MRPLVAGDLDQLDRLERTLFDAAHQGHGLGRRLLTALVGHAREVGAAQVLLEVRVDNAPAIHLYESSGFTMLGRRRAYYQPGNIDAYTMRLPLEGA